MKILRFTALALALAAGGVFAQQAAAPAASAPQDTLRPEVATPARAAIELLRDSKFQEALAKVAEAEKAPNRTPYENFVLDQVRAGAAAGAGDTATAVRSYEAVLATNRMPPDEVRKITEGLTGTYFQQKDYPKAVDAARRHLAAGGTSVQVRRVMTQSLYLQKEYAPAAKEALALAAEDEAANRRPGEDLLRLAAASQNQLKDEAAYAQTLERLLRHHPKPLYWRDRIARLQRAASFDDAFTIDAYRLLFATGSMDDENDYAILADLAQRALVPAEAVAVLDAAAAAGKLTKPDVKALKDKAAKEAAADLKEFDRNAPPPSTANALITLGLAQATAGRTDRGIALVEQGLAKGGATRPEAAKLRLAWIQAQAGRKAPAQALLRELQSAGGTAGEIARLWLIHLDRPTAG